MTTKLRYIVGGIVVFIAVGAAAYLLSESQIQYVTIATARTTGKKVQIKGKWVERDSAFYDQATNTFTFVLEDGDGNRIRVEYDGAKPNNFELAESVVVRGRVEAGRFHASEILTKCPSKYQGNSTMSPQAQ
jgi:cytochrome c-type biogenesis protein CcmE